MKPSCRSLIRFALGLGCAAVGPGAFAAAEGKSPPPSQASNEAAVGPSPTLKDIAYGNHPRQVLDFWQVDSARPTPLLFFIHGGGWVSSDKRDVITLGHLARYLAAGISVVSINYRYAWQAMEAGVMPPVIWPLQDAARALQFVRSKSSEWNIDKGRIGASGPSAGGCSSLWLALRDDMAQPVSPDPIARESTRLLCAGVNIAQTTLDPQQMREWTPNSRYGGHAFGFMPDPKNLKTRDSQFPEFLAAREKLLPLIREYSPFAWASPDDPPIYLWYRTPPALGKEENDPTHSANFGVKLQERLRSFGVPCELMYPGTTGASHATSVDFLIQQLRPQASRETQG